MIYLDTSGRSSGDRASPAMHRLLASPLGRCPSPMHGNHTAAAFNSFLTNCSTHCSQSAATHRPACAGSVAGSYADTRRHNMLTLMMSSCAIPKLDRPLPHFRRDFLDASSKIFFPYDVSHFDWFKLCHDPVTLSAIPYVSLAGLMSAIANRFQDYRKHHSYRNLYNLAYVG